MRYDSRVHHTTTMDFDDNDGGDYAWEQRCYELEMMGIDPDTTSDEYDDDSEALTAAERNPSMLR